MFQKPKVRMLHAILSYKLYHELFLLCHRLVKLGTPYVDVMIIAGAVVSYTIVILFGVDENVASYTIVDGLCHTRIWLLSIGFSLLYGTIFAKTWKIYYTFNRTKSDFKFVSVQLIKYVCDLYFIGSQRHLFVWNCWSTNHNRYNISDTSYSDT